MVGWPSEGLQEGGLSRAARRGLLTALGAAEIERLCDASPDERERELREVLRGLGVLGCGDAEIAALQMDVLEMRRENTEGALEETTVTGEVCRWDYSGTPRRHATHSTEFREKGHAALQAVCQIATQLGIATGMLLQQNVILLPARYLAHISQCPGVTVTFQHITGPPIILAVNPKQFFAVGKGCGMAFSFSSLRIIDSASLTIIVEKPTKNGSLVTLNCCIGVLFNVLSTEEGDRVRLHLKVDTANLNGTCTHGLDGDAPPKAGVGVVHRHGWDETFAGVALKLDEYDICYRELNKQQQEELPSLLKSGAQLHNDSTPCLKPLSMVRSTKQERQIDCKVMCASIPEQAGIAASSALMKTISWKNPGDTEGNLFFDLDWNFCGFVVSGQLLAYSSILSRMREMGFLDSVRGNKISQGDGLLDGCLKINAKKAKPTALSADRLAWSKGGNTLISSAFDQPEVLDLPDLHSDSSSSSPSPSPSSSSFKLPPFGVRLLNAEGANDVMASDNTVISIHINTEGTDVQYLLTNNRTAMLRGECRFYNLLITPRPAKPFRLVATVEVLFTGALRYPLHKRHLAPQYPVMAKPPLSSCLLNIIAVTPSAEETEIMHAEFALSERSLGPRPPQKGVVFTLCHSALGSGSILTSYPSIAGLKERVGGAPLLLSGNIFGGNPDTIACKGENMIPLLPHLGVACSVVGPHDMQYGAERFGELSGKCTFPWVLSNVATTGSTVPPANALEYTTLDIPGGKKVGIIGIVEEDWSLQCSGADKRFYCKEKVGEAKRLGKMLREGGCVFVVCLTNMQLKHDVALAEKVGGVVDVILGGGETDVFCTKVNGVFVVRSGRDISFLHRISFAVKENTAVEVRCEAECCPPLDVPTPASFTKNLLSAADTLNHSLSTTILSSSPFQHTPEIAQTVLSQFISDSILEYYRVLGCTVALLPASCISGGINPAKGISRRELYSVITSVEPMVVLEVVGEDVLGLVELGLDALPGGSKNFLHYAGLEVTVDLTKEPGTRIAEAKVGCENSVGGWRPLDPALLCRAALPAGVASQGKFQRCKRMIGARQSVGLHVILEASLARSKKLSEETDSRLLFSGKID